MSLNAATIEILITKGLSAADLLEVARAMEKTADPTNAERQARYRARRDVDVETWARLRVVVLERDGNKCTYCGATDRIEVDHILPLSKGGKSTLDNLTAACRSCNGGKSGRTPEEWLA